MAKKKQPTKKKVEVKEEKAVIETPKETKEFNGYIIINGKEYKVSKAKADECVKRGIAKYK
jgi:hypothetical protein